MVSELDKIIGDKLKEVRLQNGFSREQLSSKLGVTHQQIQKYEEGKNRIAASRLYQIANIFDMDMNYFFNRPIMQVNNSTEVLYLARYFSKIKSEQARKLLSKLVRVLAQE